MKPTSLEKKRNCRKYVIEIGKIEDLTRLNGETGTLTFRMKNCFKGLKKKLYPIQLGKVESYHNFINNEDKKQIKSYSQM